MTTLEHADERAGEQSTDWRLEMLEDLELPGWFIIPAGQGVSEVEAWADDVAQSVLGVLTPPEDGSIADAVRDEVDYAVGLAAEADALVAFQAWPVDFPVSVVCMVSVVAGEFRPSELGVESRVVQYPAAGKHLGPGVQYTFEREIVLGEETTKVVSVLFVFSDGETSLVLSLSEAQGAVCARAVPGLVVLKDAIGLRRRDGVRFKATETSDATAPDEWQTEE